MKKYTLNLQNDIIKQYKKNIPVLDIALNLKISKSYVYKLIVDYKKTNKLKNTYAKRPNTGFKRKYFFNENYFEKIDSEDKAYFLGFLYADGYILQSKGRNNVLFQLKIDDVSILEKFTKILESERPLLNLTKKNKNQIRMIISSKKFVNDLINLGCHQNKSFTIEFPKIKKDLFNHFLRGYFDGDGCIYIKPNKKQAQVSFTTGSEIFLNQLSEYFFPILKTKGYIKSYKKSKAKSLVYGGRNIIEKFYYYLYKDSSIFLNRKKEKFEDYLKVAK